MARSRWNGMGRACRQDILRRWHYGGLSRSYAQSERRPDSSYRWRDLRMSAVTTRPGLSQDEIARRIHELGEWFQNMDLGGVPTAPAHFLGDYPGVKFRNFAQAIPESL